MQVKVTRVSKKDTKSDGTKLINKYDKPYWKISIQIEGSEEWYGGFANNAQDPMYHIEEGGTYSVTLSTSPKADGGVWHNFKLLTPEEKELEELREFKKQKEAALPKADEEVDLDKF